jgi:hypothetical protein
MSIKLGGTDSVVIRKGDDRVRLIFKTPTTQQMTQYSGELAALRSKLDKDDKAVGKALDIRMKYACQILVDVQGDIETPDGMTKLDAIRDYGFDFLHKLASYVFEGEKQEDADIDLGKSDETQKTSMEEESADDSEQPASTSSKSTRRSGTPAAESAPTA